MPRSRAICLATLLVATADAQGLRVEAESRTVFLSYPVERFNAIDRMRSDELAATLIELERVEAWGLSLGGGRLSLRQSGWLLGDFDEETRERAFTGNLRTLYATWARGPVELRLGRQYVVGGATRIAPIDGGLVRWLGPAGIEISAHGGWRALPRFSDSPYYARLGDRFDDRVAPGLALEDRTASGFTIVGGRIGETVPRWGRGGVSFVQENEAEQLARRMLGFDLALERARWPWVEANMLYDLAAQDMAEVRFFADVGPYAGVTVTPSYRREDPTLLLSKTSIMSVFASTAYHEAGAEVAWRGSGFTLEAGGFGLSYPDDQTGARVRAAAGARKGKRHPVSARVGYQRQAVEERGYHGGNASFMVEGLGPARATAEVWAFLFDEEQNGVDYSVTPQASVGASKWGVDFDGAMGWHTGPSIKRGAFGMVKARVPLGNRRGFGLAPERTRALPRRTGDQLRFSHVLHLDMGTACEDCHGAAAEAGVGDRLLPTHETCAECHAEVEEDDGCQLCHSQPKRARKLARPDRGLRFEHKRHSAQAECLTCHGPVEKSEKVEDDAIPDMAVCLSCHQHSRQFAQLDCTPCHVRPVPGPAPLTEFYAHTGDWKRRHQDVARGKGAVCGTCHDQAFCGDCHESPAPAVPAALFAEQPDRAQFHRGWYLDRHAVDARAEPAACMRCHGRTSCDSCHIEAGVSAIALGAVNPHPRGWVVQGASSFHGPVARRHLAECVACHDHGPASNCVSCHGPGGSGGSPHGPGFDSALSRSDAVCSICHAN